MTGRHKLGASRAGKRKGEGAALATWSRTKHCARGAQATRMEHGTYRGGGWGGGGHDGTHPVQEEVEGCDVEVTAWA